jgi:thymidylate synthase
MSFYKTFSDDSIVMRGAYGPKIIDQLGYVVDAIEHDKDSRQAVINIWRERPGPSKDIPCTTSLQFIVRKGRLNCIATMRSNDVVKGFTYDVFTFSMISLYVSHLLRARGIYVNLGDLYVNVGSLHLYDSDRDKAKGWVKEDKIVSNNIDVTIMKLIDDTNHLSLINKLKEAADEYRNIARS